MPTDFPIMRTWKERENITFRTSIPLAMILPHEPQAQANHGQTLYRLSERGGLSPNEAICVLEDRKWEPIEHIEARNKLEALVAAWKTK